VFSLIPALCFFAVVSVAVCSPEFYNLTQRSGPTFVTIL
jgi:hypothetical protein